MHFRHIFYVYLIPPCKSLPSFRPKLHQNLYIYNSYA